jgi:hypothetical protein
MVALCITSRHNVDLISLSLKCLHTAHKDNHRDAIQRTDISCRKSLKFYAVSLRAFPCLLSTWASKNVIRFFSLLLSAFATLGKETVNFVLSIRQHKTRLSNEILNLRIVRKSANKT